MASAHALELSIPMTAQPGITSVPPLPLTEHNGNAASAALEQGSSDRQNTTEIGVKSGRPQGINTIAAEVGFILTCSVGQLMFAIYLANTFVLQIRYTDALSLKKSYAAWLSGSFLVANGVSVVLSGSLADLSDPKWMAIASLVWLTIWNIVGVFTIQPSRTIAFFIARAMMGLSVGTLCSCAMSMLGRLYRPGNRKNKVFATMGGMIPTGFAIGAIQGGALSAHLEWVYGSTAIASALCALIAWSSIPSAAGRRQGVQGDPISLRDFDVLGAAAGTVGCGLLIFGLTQGAPTNWQPYTYALIIVALLCFVAFGFIESRARRPLIDNRLWKVAGFVPLMLAYFIGYGAYVGGCVFYAVRFFLTIQHKSPLIAGLYLIPFGVNGPFAAWLTSRLLHVVPGHYILISSAIAFSLGPVFFLPQNEKTIYWALSFPGFILSDFGPDLSFAAVSVFITSNVPRSFQGAAGSLVITAQNLSSAIFAAIADTMGQQLGKSSDSEFDLDALRAIWWFALAACLCAVLISLIFVRIPKSEESDHVE